MKRLNVQELLITAQERTGLSDFGPPDFMEGLTVLVDSLNTDAKIADDRWSHARERMLRLLMNRLWFAKDVAEQPAILDQDIGSPVFIVSLPRTGSTKLHRMLGATQDFQTLLLWTVHMFARIPGLEDGGKARRIEETRAYEKWMCETSPAVLTGHPMFTEEPEEDEWLLEAAFRYSTAFSMFNVTSFIQWLIRTDMQPAFDYFRSQLQYLQWQSGSLEKKPWLLKTPNHMGAETFLTRTFKKPRFIITHRDPVKCAPSSVSTGLAWHKLYSDSESNFGDGVLAALFMAATGHLKWRDENPDLEILDLSFREITEDGVGTARKVYNFLGMPFTPAAEQGVLQWERNNPKDKHGKGVYSAAAIGTTDDKIREMFRPYMERFSEFI